MDKLRALLGEHLLRDEVLAKYTAARLGGIADWLYIAKPPVQGEAEAALEALSKVVSIAWSEGIPVRVLGGGANVLVSGQGVRGLVIINRISEVKFGNWFGRCNVSAASGTSLSTLSHKCEARGFAGAEWLVSVPGTVGGAVVNNAGAHGGDMAGIVDNVVVAEPSGPKLYSRDDLGFAYRHSMFKERTDCRFLVLLATFAMQPDDPKAMSARMQEHTAFRKRTQPPGASLGSIFKNPTDDYAGRLIEAAGLKGYTIGGAQVSPIHANFFINTGHASPEDYYALIRHVRQTVHEQMGVELEMEIELVGEF